MNEKPTKLCICGTFVPHNQTVQKIFEFVSKMLPWIQAHFKNIEFVARRNHYGVREAKILQKGSLNFN